MDRIKGYVKFFNYQRGFGFIEVDEQDYFVHVTDVDGDMLLGGELVEFKPVEGSKGLQAIEVYRVNPPEMDQELGEVLYYDSNRGFGFISREAKADVFAHFTDFEEITAAEDIEVGMRVSFVTRQGRDGRDRAYKIKILD